MKKTFIIIIGLLFTASTVLAKPNKTDKQMLFGSNTIDITILSKDEMQSTNGKSVFIYNWWRMYYPRVIIMPNGYPIYRQPAPWGGFYYF